MNDVEIQSNKGKLDNNENNIDYKKVNDQKEVIQSLDEENKKNLCYGLEVKSKNMEIHQKNYLKESDEKIQTNKEDNNHNQENQEPPMKLIEFIFKFAKKKEYIFFFFAFLGSLISGATMPLYAYFIGKTMKTLNLEINNFSIQNDLKNILILYAVLGFGLFLVNFVTFVLWNKFGITMTSRYKKNSLLNLFNQNQDLFDSMNPFQLSTYLQTQFFSIEIGLGNKIGNIISSFSKILTGIVIAMLISWKLSLVLIIIMPISYFIGNYAAKASVKDQKLTYEKISAAGAILEEVLYQIKTVSSFANFKYEFDRYDKLVNEGKDITIRNNTKLSIFFNIIYFLKYFNYFVAIFYGSIIISNNEKNLLSKQVISGGEINTIILCLIYSGFGLGNIMEDLKDLFFARVAATQLQLLEDEKKQESNNKEKKINEETIPKQKVRGEIEFKNVNFFYPQSPDNLVLKNFNLKIEPGKKVAIVGESGSGKSTIVNLIERLYEINEGEIFIDGINIINYDLDFLRSLIGYVQQEPVLFDRSVKDNIVFYRDKEKFQITDEVIENAAKNSLAIEFIKKKQGQFEYKVGIKGKNLSGGEKQRLAIARAILLNPKILILDEATSALDNYNEKEVQKSLDNLDDSITKIIIAHRLSTILNSDLIVAMKDGEIVEKGSHLELLNKEGYYWNLFSSQTLEVSKSDNFSSDKLKLKIDLNNSLKNYEKKKDFNVNSKDKDENKDDKYDDKSSLSIDLLNENYVKPNNIKKNHDQIYVSNYIDYKKEKMNNPHIKNNDFEENQNIKQIELTTQKNETEGFSKRKPQQQLKKSFTTINKHEKNIKNIIRKSINNTNVKLMENFKSLENFQKINLNQNYFSLNENMFHINNIDIELKKKQSGIEINKLYETSSKIKPINKKCQDNQMNSINNEITNSLLTISKFENNKKNIDDFKENSKEIKKSIFNTDNEKNILDDSQKNNIYPLAEGPNNLKFYSFMGKNKNLVILGIINSCLNGSISPIYGILLAISLTILSNEDSKYVKTEGFKISMVYLSLAIIATILNYFQQYISTRIKENYCKNLRSYVLEKLLKIHISYFDDEENNPGALISKISQDLHNINDILFFLIEELLKSLVLLLLGLGISFSYDWRLSLIGVGMFPIIVFSLFIQVKYKNALILKYNQMTSDAGDILSESLISTKTLFIFNIQYKIVKIYTNIIKDGLRSLIKQSAISGLADGFEEFINFLSYGLTFYAGGRFIIEKSLNYEDMMKCIFSISFFTIGLSSIQKNLGNLPVAKEAINRMFSLLNIEDYIKCERFVSLPHLENHPKIDKDFPNKKIKGKIEFRNVYFSYPQAPETLVLKNVSFVIDIGQKAAIVGSSGSGKSTIIQLIERFYDATKGEIMIDDIDIKEYDIIYLRKQIGLVMQEPVIFKRSLQENIEYGKLGSTREEIYKAAENANIYDLLNLHENKGENLNSNVSGGQKQRISIARVILKDPNIILFDEATSALDEESEKEVILAIDRLSIRKTSLSIAHRLKTIENSDIIFVMDKGRIIEKGTHKELLNLNGFYFKQYNYI